MAVQSFFARVLKTAGPPTIIDETSDARALASRSALTTSKRGSHLQAISAISRLDPNAPETQAPPRSDDMTIEEIGNLRREMPRILSSDPDNALYCEVEHRKSLIIFEGGLMIVAKAQRNSIIVSDMMNRGANAKTPITSIRTAEIITIQNLYGGEAAQADTIDYTKTQEVFYERVAEAAKSHASDIHIKTDGVVAQVAYTIKGDFIPVCDLPREDAERQMRAAFAASDTGDKTFNPLKPRQTRLDNSEKFHLPKGLQALRLQFTPIANGNIEMVARLLYNDADTNLNDIDTLGYEHPQIECLNVMRRQAYGIILISGPTGSGKSTTLKVALEKTWHDRGGRSKIVTIEDPTEYTIRGATQIPIESGATLEEKEEAFIRAMSSMLRMAPNIGMVGEIRERIAAKLTFDMAKTGHLVWASVHANTALDTIVRVRDMGVGDIDLTDPYLMRGLIAQRLVKSLCPQCSVPFVDVLDGKIKSMGDQPTLVIEDWMKRYYGGELGGAQIQDMRLARPGGCPQCRDDNGRGTGHIGRKVVAETIIPSKDVLQKVIEGNMMVARERWLQEGDNATMLEHGLVRVLRGEVSPLDLTYVGDVALEIDPQRVTRIKAIFGRA